MKRIEIQYFAIFREAVGQSNEVVRTDAATAQVLYRELADQYGFKLDESLVRVAINDEFASMGTTLNDGDRVVFIPPVAGG